VYRIEWFDRDEKAQGVNWSGQRSLREIPFIPEVNVTVTATYAHDVKKGSYGYTINNSHESEAAVINALLLEAINLTPDQVRLGENVPRADKRFEAEDLRVHFFLPRKGYLKNFRLKVFGKENTEPGQVTRIPPMLSVPWEQLPGVIRCWIEVEGWDHGFSADLDP